MVKGNNTVKNNKSVSFQPYDVSNSLVKKVTSRVSELLHQPTWIGKWLAMPSQGAVDYDTGDSPQSDANSGNHDLHSSSEDDLLAEQPPAKRARVPYNPQYSNLQKLTFPSSEPGTSLGQGVSPIVNHGKITDNNLSMPGPSNRMSFVASTPQVNNCVSNPTESSSKTNINGDDNCSDSSESTSGCSSLVPQDNQFKKNSSSINVSGETSNLSRSRIQHGRMNTNTLAAQRPSFNASSFMASSKRGVSPSPNTSPFYSGRTMYGGASHYRRCAEVGGLFSPTHHSPGLTCRPSVSPCRATSTTGMSSTARRILDALEQFSTPVLDAKRIPLKKQSPITDERIRPNKRKMAELSSSIPTTPDLLRLKRKERLQDSTLAARHMSSTFSTPASDYSIREDDGETCDSYKGKIKTKRKDRDKELNVTPLEVNLPNAFLGVRALPKIDIALPPKPSPISKPIPPSSSLPSSVFKFSKPSFDTFKKVNFSKSNLSESTSVSTTQSNVMTQSSTSPSMNFVYKPANMMPKEKKSISIDKSCQTPVENEKPKPAVSEQKQTGSLFGKKTDSPKNADALAPQSKTASTFLGSFSNPPKKEEAKAAPAICSTGFGDKFKKPEGSWECSACLIQNKPDVSKCIACETPKPSSSGSSVAPASSGFSAASAFGADKFKMPEDPSKAPKTSSNSSTTPSSTFTGLSSFGDKFKKPEGAWECSVCMVQNKADVSKCVACETDKPGSGGSSTPAMKSSGFSLTASSNEPKFNFGVDKANEPKFSFGINKAETKDKSSISSGFKFGDNGTAPISGTPSFSFGVPADAKATSKVTPPPAFKFNPPTSADQKSGEPKINFSAPTPPKTALDVTDSGAPPAKKSLNFANPFSSVDVKQSIFDGNKNVLSPGKSEATAVQSKTDVPTFSVPTSTCASDSRKTSMPSSTFSFGTSAFSPAQQSPLSAATNQSVTAQPLQSQKAVQDMKIESTSTQPSVTSSVTLNHTAATTASPKSTFSFESSSVFKPAAGGFSFGGAAAEKPKENLFGSVDKPKESLFGNTEKPKESLFGGIEKPKESVFGGIEKPKESLFGTTEAPKESIFGSADKPQTNLFRSAENKVGITSPQLGNGFGTATGGFAFGNTSSAPTSNAFSFGGSKPAEATPAPAFGVNTNPTSVFSFNPSSEAAPVSASPFGSASTNSFSSPFQPTATTTAAESKPVFSFGSAAPPAAPVGGGFSFNAAPAVNKLPGFNFSAPQANNAAQPGSFSFATAAASAPKQEQPNVFMFKPETPQQNNVFGNPAAPPNQSPFGAPANPPPSFGAPSQPSFNFGGNTSAPASQPVFAFGGGQNSNAAPLPVFGTQPVNAAPTFSPNIPSSFNFTGGATPSFSATPSASVGGVPQRRIKKAVRRTQR